jgi:outer membrane lipoprotein-sorting protein
MATKRMILALAAACVLVCGSVAMADESQATVERVKATVEKAAASVKKTVQKKLERRHQTVILAVRG